MTNLLVDFREVVTRGFFGVGVQWSAYPWWDLNEEEWDRVFRRLEFMRLPLTRTMQNAFYYWTGDDEEGLPRYDFDSSYQQKLRKLLDWCEANGTRVIFGEWGAPTSIEGVRLADDDRRWTRMVGDFLSDLFRRGPYRCVQLFNLVNEPHGDWSTIAGRFDTWKRAMLNLSDELRRRGLEGRLGMVGPDADEDWLDRNLEDPQLRDAVNVFDVHWYVRRAELSTNSVERRCRAMRARVDELAPGKPLLFGELGVEDGKTSDDRQPNVVNFGYGVEMADAAVQLMRGGGAGFIAWYLDDAMHFLGDGEYVRGEGEPLLEDAYDRRKVWGMWNSLGDRRGQPQEAELRPWFYAWSLLTRYFPAGCEIVTVGIEGSSSVTAAAASVAEGGEQNVTLVIVNRAERSEDITVVASGGRGAFDLCRYDYYDLDQDGRPDAWPRSVDESGADIYPTPTGFFTGIDFSEGLRLGLPGRGVTLLTSLKFERPPRKDQEAHRAPFEALTSTERAG